MSTVRSLPKRIPVLARLLGARRAVEVGTFTRYSAIAIARGLAADGGLLCCEANAEWAYQQAENANHWTRCLPGRSRELGLQVGSHLDRRAPGTVMRKDGHMMARTVAKVGIAFLVWTLGYAGPATAGPTDTPFPTFSDGRPAVSVYIAAGVIKNNNLETDVVCTNVDTVAVDIGLEVFDETGALRNSIAAGSGASLNVGVGKTVTVGTAGTAELHEDQVITLNGAGNATTVLRNGSGRVVATSRNIICTAVVVDKLHTVQDPAVSSLPPPSLAQLQLIKLP